MANKVAIDSSSLLWYIELDCNRLPYRASLKRRRPTLEKSKQRLRIGFGPEQLVGELYCCINI